MSFAIEKGERLTCPFPAASLLDWIMTLTVSTGWITEVARAPEMEPTKKGLKSNMNRLSLGLVGYAVEVISQK